MAYIETTSPADAEGRLQRTYDAATKRAGRVFQILRIMSPNPAVLDAAMGLYAAVMFGPSPLPRVEREAIAVAVSSANDCFY